MPKVSVIVPVYNVEKYLSKCLDSILNQTLEDIEIICVNDGSTDGSPEILRQYAIKDARIKVIDKSNGGQSSARNAGMESAGSKYIGFVDSDDWIEPETYETALSKMLEDDEIDFVCWGCNIVPEEKTMNCVDAEKTHFLRYSGKQELNDDVLLGTAATVCNRLWKRERISKNKLIFPPGLIFEDASFFWNYVADCKYAYYLDKYFYNYLQHKDSVMGGAFDEKYQTPFRLLCWETIYQCYSRKNMVEAKEPLLKRLFEDLYSADMGTVPQLEAVDKCAIEMIRKYGLNVDIKKVKDNYRNYSFLEKIFSIKNSPDRLYKIICIFGLKIRKFRKNPKRRLSKCNEIEKEV